MEHNSFQVFLFFQNYNILCFQLDIKQLFTFNKLALFLYDYQSNRTV